MTNIVFIAKDAKWQKYRNEIFCLLAEKFNYDVTVLTCGKIADHIVQGKNVRYHTFRNLFPEKWKISFFPGALFYLLRKKPRAVLAINNISQITEYFSFILCKITGIKFIWWTHAYDHGPERTMLKNETLKNLRIKIGLFFLKISDAIIAFSEKGKEYLIRCGVNGSKIFCAPNTLNTQLMFEHYNQLEATSSKDQIKNEYGLPAGSRIVLFCGRLQKRKNVDLLIKAFSRIEQENFFLLIVGEGSEKSSLQSLANKLNAKNVRFLGEIYEENQLSKIFFLSDLFVMPGAIGLSIVQSFSYRLPVITLEDPNHGPEIQYFEQNVNGFMFKKGDIEAIAGKIHELFADEVLLGNLSENAFRTAKNKCNMNNTLGAINHAFSFALSKKRGRQ